MATIISECGKNYITVKDSKEGWMEEAKELALQAKLVGTNIVKFQTHSIDELKLRDHSRHEWIKFNILPLEFWRELKQYCDQIQVEFLSTPMSLESAKLLNPLVKRWKIGSGNVQDYELLDFVSKTNKPMILSTGMSELSEIDKAVTILGTSKLTIMHCTSIYPCPDYLANLNVINTLRNRYGVKMGYSDHTLNPMIPAFAVAMGVSVVEKHFTLRKDSWGPDHHMSFTPNQFKEMIANIRAAELVMGTGLKTISPQEAELRKIFRK